MPKLLDHDELLVGSDRHDVDPIDAIEQAKIDREVEEEQRKEMRRQHYQSMFGSPQCQDYQVQPKEQEQQPERKTDPRLAQLAKCLPNGMRI